MVIQMVNSRYYLEGVEDGILACIEKVVSLEEDLQENGNKLVISMVKNVLNQLYDQKVKETESECFESEWNELLNILNIKVKVRG